jgi:hypothetical protein
MASEHREPPWGSYESDRHGDLCFGEQTHWLVADITEARAWGFTTCGTKVQCFIFLLQTGTVLRMLRQVAHTVKAGGNVIVSTFGPEGPTLALPSSFFLRLPGRMNGII